jgi:N-hydroxyarylamine O-acetyltransferase
MESRPLTASDVDSYLDVLGQPRERPSLGALKRLVRAQLIRIPFETISKLHYLHRLGLRDVPSLGLYVDGIRRFNFGGTCYSNNLHFSRLLRALGYDATLCGADMPSGADVHAAIVVTLAGRDWLVDAGYAAPLLCPLALDLEHGQEVRAGADRWVLQPRDDRGRARLEHWRGDERVHGYLLKPVSIPSESFDRAVRDSFRPDATFMNAILAVRCFPRQTVTVYNLVLIRATAQSSTVERLPDRAAVASALEQEFGILSSITRDAIANLGTFGSIHG